MKLNMYEWQILIFEIKAKCKINIDNVSYEKKKIISDRARNLARHEIINSKMTKTLNMYPNIIFFDDLIDEVINMDKSMDIYNITRYVKLAVLYHDAYAIDYFTSEDTRKILKDFMEYVRPFWPSKNNYEQYFYNRWLYYKLLKNKNYSMKVKIIRKIFEAKITIFKKNINSYCLYGGESQIIVENMINQVIYGAQ